VRNVDEISRWIEDHELQHKRDREERRVEDARLIDAVKKHVDGLLQPLVGMPAKLEKLTEVNKEQLEILKESAEERGRRKEREELAAKKKSEDELELERAKVKAANDAREANERIEAIKQRNFRLQVLLGAVVAVAVALIGVLFARH